MNYRLLLTQALLLGLLAAAAGCNTDTAQNATPEAPLVTVAHPAFETVKADTEEFQGSTVPPPGGNVDLTARVTGYLDKVLFKDGDEVKADQPLFLIDERPYQAELDRAQGRIDQAQAKLTRLSRDLARDKRLVVTGAVSQSEYDKDVGDNEEAAAALKSAQANTRGYELDLEFCKIKAPISGRISNARIDPGNLVKADVTVLTNVVTVDPMDATFDVDQRILQQIQELVRQGKVEHVGENFVVYLRTGVEEGLPHKGVVNFIDNKVNSATGTLRVRASFPNPKVNAKGEPDPNGTRILTPGLGVKVNVPIGAPYQAQLVAEGALLSEQGQRYVYVVKDGKAERRFVDVGSLKEGNLRVILPAVKKEDGSIAKGLEASDLVVVNGIQRVRAGKPVRTEGDPVPMADAAK
jgi:RND family efflux transporter MFP subunit